MDCCWDNCLRWKLFICPESSTLDAILWLLLFRKRFPEGASPFCTTGTPRLTWAAALAAHGCTERHRHPDIGCSLQLLQHGCAGPRRRSQHWHLLSKTTFAPSPAQHQPAPCCTQAGWMCTPLAPALPRCGGRWGPGSLGCRCGGAARLPHCMEQSWVNEPGRYVQPCLGMLANGCQLCKASVGHWTVQG